MIKWINKLFASKPFYTPEEFARVRHESDTYNKALDTFIKQTAVEYANNHFEPNDLSIETYRKFVSLWSNSESIRYEFPIDYYMSAEGEFIWFIPKHMSTGSILETLVGLAYANQAYKPLYDEYWSRVVNDGPKKVGV